ncbi:MAG: hypothetical protein K2X27_11330 [Candidatus Obscuribacterales bacterium]|nr:hypothetical protein [Candidatus Obscuribacterales bacterium]
MASDKRENRLFTGLESSMGTIKPAPISDSLTSVREQTYRAAQKDNDLVGTASVVDTSAKLNNHSSRHGKVESDFSQSQQPEFKSVNVITPLKGPDSSSGRRSETPDNVAAGGNFKDPTYSKESSYEAIKGTFDYSAQAKESAGKFSVEGPLFQKIPVHFDSASQSSSLAKEKSEFVSGVDNVPVFQPFSNSEIQYNSPEGVKSSQKKEQFQDYLQTLPYFQVAESNNKKDEVRASSLLNSLPRGAQTSAEVPALNRNRIPDHLEVAPIQNLLRDQKSESNTHAFGQMDRSMRSSDRKNESEELLVKSADRSSSDFPHASETQGSKRLEPLESTSLSSSRVEGKDSKEGNRIDVYDMLQHFEVKDGAKNISHSDLIDRILGVKPAGGTTTSIAIIAGRIFDSASKSTETSKGGSKRGTESDESSKGSKKDLPQNRLDGEFKAILERIFQAPRECRQLADLIDKHLSSKDGLKPSNLAESSVIPLLQQLSEKQLLDLKNRLSDFSKNPTAFTKFDIDAQRIIGEIFKAILAPSKGAAEAHGTAKPIEHVVVPDTETIQIKPNQLKWTSDKLEAKSDVPQSRTITRALKELSTIQEGKTEITRFLAGVSEKNEAEFKLDPAVQQLLIRLLNVDSVGKHQAENGKTVLLLDQSSKRLSQDAGTEALKEPEDNNNVGRVIQFKDRPYIRVVESSFNKLDTVGTRVGLQLFEQGEWKSVCVYEVLPNELTICQYKRNGKFSSVKRHLPAIKGLQLARNHFDRRWQSLCKIYNLP